MKINVDYIAENTEIKLVSPRVASANKLRRKLADVKLRPRLKYLGEDDLSGPGDDVFGDYLAEQAREMRELDERSI